MKTFVKRTNGWKFLGLFSITRAIRKARLRERERMMEKRYNIDVSSHSLSAQCLLICV